jgi:hypothetical protein
MRFAHGSFRKGRIFLKLIIGNKGDHLLANTWDAANARIFEKLGFEPAQRAPENSRKHQSAHPKGKEVR